MSNQTYLYDFPYQPYPQQVRLMDELHNVITNRKLGIFESPTGTGKSLSVLCSSLHWLLENEENEISELIKRKHEIKQAVVKTQSELDWVEAFDKKQKLQLKFMDKIDELEKKKKIIDNIKLIKMKRQSINKPILSDKSYLNKNDDDDNDDNVVNYDSNDEALDENNDSEKEGSITKIYYCSRTHSQLNQVLKELLKTNYANKIVTCCFGSRQNLCVNNSVNQLKSINLINEKCLDLQKPIVETISNEEPINKKQKRSTANCCTFKCGSKIAEMSKSIIQNTMDIEDLFTGGIKSGGCPFYAVKQTINKAHLILMPYQNMLNPAARIACEINLKDNVIIIDEAHNLLDSISSVNSVKLSLFHIQTCSSQLDRYYGKYLNRLSDRNLFYIRQLQTILRNIETCLTIHRNSVKSFDCVRFVFDAHLKDFDMGKLINYLNKSKLAFKLRNSMRMSGGNADVVVTQRRNSVALFAGSKIADRNELQEEEKTTEEFGNAMLVFKNFLSSISQELGGRIILDNGESITYLVVDPGKYLADIIGQCRSMIVIGGTMQPFSEFSERLFKRANCSSDRIHTFSCDHVIDAGKQMKVVTLGVGINNQSLKFTFENRSDRKIIKETGELLHSMFTFSPNGTIVFFPSYDVMFTMIDEWQSNGTLSNIEKIKPVFIEPRKANQIENIMRNFTAATKFRKGAVLFAVIGAKMSEGINFCDELARLIVIIGIPYPQKQNIVLQEKMKFIEQEYSKLMSNIMYQNLAMKAVNQAIGRAIRHKNDFAGIVLLDERYKCIVNISENEIANGKLSLPKWMKNAVSFHNTSNSALLELKMFFEAKSQT